MKLALSLLLLIAACHYSYEWLALLYADHRAAGRAIFYIARGIEGTALFVVIAHLARNRWVSLVCLFGLFEESQTAICRAAKPIAERPAVELFQGLCGEPWYGAGIFIAGAIALAMYYELGRLRGHKRPEGH